MSELWTPEVLTEMRLLFGALCIEQDGSGNPVNVYAWMDGRWQQMHSPFVALDWVWPEPCIAPRSCKGWVATREQRSF